MIRLGTAPHAPFHAPFDASFEALMSGVPEAHNLMRHSTLYGKARPLWVSPGGS